MKETKDKHFIQKPQYEGGLKAMKKFISENLKYPKAALENKIEGTVHIDYKVSHKGQVLDAKVISGLGNGCDEEAIRLVKMLKFSEARNRKIRATFNKKIQIHFRLPKAKPVAKPQIKLQSKFQNQTSTSDLQYQYVLTPAKSQKTKKMPPKKKGKSYTIRINQR